MLLLAWWLLLPAGAWLPGELGAPVRAGSATAATETASARKQAGGEPARRGGEHFSLDAVTHVSQLEGPEARRLLTEGDRLSMLFAAQLACDAIEIDRKFGRVNALPPTQRRSAEFRIAFADDFCDPTLPHYTEYSRRLAELDVHDETAIAMGLQSLEAEEAEAIGVPTAAALIRESQSVSALRLASNFLVLSGRNLPQVQRLPFPASMRDSESRMDAQRMAVDMVACGIRGGCGARGIETMAWCRPCGPSVTMEQVYQRYPPTVVAYARELAAEIAADRRRAGTR